MISLRYVINFMILSVMLVFVAPSSVFATAAGSVVNNTATVKYSSGSGDITITSSDSFTVQELLAHSLLWQDASNVPVQTGDTSRVLTYDLFNNGNGLDEYSLILNTGVGTDQFDPLFAAIYLDINNSGSYDLADTLYNPGSVTPSFGEGEFIRVFVVANIPAALTDGNIGTLELTAISNSVSLPVSSGDIIVGAGDGGTDIVVAIDDATVTLEASFVVNSYITMLKTFVINSAGGGSQPAAGATVEYTIVVSMAGAGTVNNIVITDPIPANTTYVPGSIFLDNVSMLDGLDADEADYNLTTPGAISVILGTMNGGDADREIRFTVTID